MEIHLDVYGHSFEEINGGFTNDGYNYKLYFTPDLPRMLKLACNGLGELETFLNSKSQEIEWKFTTLFPEEQSQFSLNLLYSFWQTHSISNKFNISAIMNVKIAAQTFSSFVADMTEFMMILGHPFFKNAEATVHFMRTSDRLLNLLNVKNRYGKCFKQPPKLYNQIVWSELIDNSVEYPPTMKTIDNTPLISHRRETFIV